MASFNPMPSAAFYALRYDENGTPDAAALWQQLSDRSAWIDENMMRCGGWAQGDDGGTVPEVATVRDFGSFLLPPVGRPAGQVRVWIAVSVTAGEVTYTFAPTAGGDDGNMKPIPSAAQTLAIGASDAGLYAVDFAADIWDTSPGLRGIAVTGQGTDATANQTVDLISIHAIPHSSGAGANIDSATTPSSWPTTSIAHAAGTDTPDAASLLRQLRDAQATVAGRYPRTLGCRTPGISATVSGGAWSGTYTPGTRVYRYIVWGGGASRSNTLSIMAEATVSPGIEYRVFVTAIADQTTKQAVPVIDVDITASYGPTAITSLTPAWYEVTVDGGEIAGGDWYLVMVEVATTDGADPISGEGIVYAIGLTQEDGAASSYVDTGDVTPAGPRTAEYATGRPIVASYDDGDYTGDTGDRRSLAATVMWQGWRRAQVTVVDSPYAETSRLGTSSAATDGGMSLWFGRHRLSRDASGLTVWVRVRRTTWDAPTVRPKLTLYVGDVGAGTATEASVTLYDQPRETVFHPAASEWVWVPLSVPFTGVGGVTYNIELRAGFVDFRGNAAAPAAKGTSDPDAVALSGVMLSETAGGRHSILSDNITTGGDTLGDATGFAAYSGTPTIAASTSYAHTGATSIEMAAAITEAISTAATAVPESRAYRGSVYLCVAAGTLAATVFVRNTTTAADGPAVAVTLTTAWQQVEAVAPAVATAGDSLVLVIRADAAGTLYADTLELYPV